MLSHTISMKYTNTHKPAHKHTKTHTFKYRCTHKFTRAHTHGRYHPHKQITIKLVWLMNKASVYGLALCCVRACVCVHSLHIISFIWDTNERASERENERVYGTLEFMWWKAIYIKMNKAERILHSRLRLGERMGENEDIKERFIDIDMVKKCTHTHAKRD